MIPIVLAVSYTHQKGVTTRTQNRKPRAMTSIDPLAKIIALRTQIQVIETKLSTKSAWSLNTLPRSSSVITMYAAPTTHSGDDQKNREHESDSESEDSFDRMHTVETSDPLDDKIGTQPSARSASPSNEEDSHAGYIGFSAFRRRERGRYRSHSCGEQDDRPGGERLCAGCSREELHR